MPEVIIDGELYLPAGTNEPTTEMLARASKAVYEVTGGGVPFGPRRKRASAVTVDCHLLADVAVRAAFLASADQPEKDRQC